MAYPESSFTSLHQPTGLHDAWVPTGAAAYYRANNLSTSLRQYKVFVPPGVQDASVLMHVGQGSGLSYNFAARIGQPPASSPRSGSSSGFTYNQLVSADCFGSNSAGYVFVLSDGYFSVTNGMWLFVDFQVVSGNLIDTVSTFHVVDYAAYADWYNSATFGTDGDPTGTSTPSNPETPTIIYPVQNKLIFNVTLI